MGLVLVVFGTGTGAGRGGRDRQTERQTERQTDMTRYMISPCPLVPHLALELVLHGLGQEVEGVLVLPHGLLPLDLRLHLLCGGVL